MMGQHNRIALAIAVVAVAAATVAGLWPAQRQTLPAITQSDSPLVEHAQHTTESLSRSDRHSQAAPVVGQNALHCERDASIRTLNYFRQLSPQQWRDLNDWQRERGLSQTRLRADGELSQEPSAYVHYDTAALGSLASRDDADAQYWLAMKAAVQGQATIAHDGASEDARVEIPRLLQRAAELGHAQAMLAMANHYYEQAVNATAPGRSAMADYPDLQIKSRAWQHLAAWRMGRLPDAQTALPGALEQQSAQLAAELINQIVQQREQRGLPALDNVVPHVVIGLLQAQSCPTTTEMHRAIAQRAP